MAAIADDFNAEGIEIIWVLENGPSFEPGTAENCFDTMEILGATEGWCVGDDETVPTPDVWDDAPFSVTTNRGFEIIVRRDDMEIAFVSTHGSTAGNDNLSAADLLAEAINVRDNP